jgi:hypothetical protein
MQISSFSPNFKTRSFSDEESSQEESKNIQQEEQPSLKSVLRYKKPEVPSSVVFPAPSDSPKQLSQEEIKKILLDIPNCNKRKGETQLEGRSAKQPRRETHSNPQKTAQKLIKIRETHTRSTQIPTPPVQPEAILSRRKVKALRPSSIWTKEDDQKLLDAVEQHGHQWAHISKTYFKGKYKPRACKARYRYTLHPNRIIGKWTEEEKQKVLAGVKQYGVGQWTKIAHTYFNWTRSDLDIAVQYKRVLNPEIKHGNWTEEEEDKLIYLRQTRKLRWEQIAELMEGRTAFQCRQKYDSLV